MTGNGYINIVIGRERMERSDIDIDIAVTGVLKVASGMILGADIAGVIVTILPRDLVVMTFLPRILVVRMLHRRDHNVIETTIQRVLVLGEMIHLMLSVKDKRPPNTDLVVKIDIAAGTRGKNENIQIAIKIELLDDIFLYGES